mgnify:CR=1 FL=1
MLLGKHRLHLVGRRRNWKACSTLPLGCPRDRIALAGALVKPDVAEVFGVMLLTKATRIKGVY